MSGIVANNDITYICAVTKFQQRIKSDATSSFSKMHKYQSQNHEIVVISPFQHVCKQVCNMFTTSSTSKIMHQQGLSMQKNALHSLTRFFTTICIQPWATLSSGLESKNFITCDSLLKSVHYCIDVYRIVASRSTSRLVTCLGLFRLLMKGIFGPYVL